MRGWCQPYHQNTSWHGTDQGGWSCRSHHICCGFNTKSAIESYIGNNDGYFTIPHYRTELLKKKLKQTLFLLLLLLSRLLWLGTILTVKQSTPTQWTASSLLWWPSYISRPPARGPPPLCKCQTSGCSNAFNNRKQINEHFALPDIIDRFVLTAWEGWLLVVKVHPRGLSFSWWGSYGLCLWHKLTELATCFLFYFCAYFCLYGPFNCISFIKFSRQLCGWLGLKH